MKEKVSCGMLIKQINSTLEKNANNILRAEGQATKAMMGQVIGNLLNVVLDPVMILGFGWNITGAAIATVIGNVAAAAFTLWTDYEVVRRYQKPVEKFSKAAKAVAAGDFSVYIAPYHTADRFTHPDALFTDFNRMVEKLGSIETLKTDFISNVSHEMKTPISIIKNYAELLQADEIPEEKRKEFAHGIENAASRLSGLISNILKLNRLENRKTLPETEVYNVCGQLGECILLFEEAWEDKEIEPDIGKRSKAETVVQTSGRGAENFYAVAVRKKAVCKKAGSFFILIKRKQY